MGIKDAPELLDQSLSNESKPKHLMGSVLPAISNNNSQVGDTTFVINDTSQLNDTSHQNHNYLQSVSDNYRLQVENSMQ